MPMETHQLPPQHKTGRRLRLAALVFLLAASPVALSQVSLAEAVGLDRGCNRSLIKGAFLHDVGKIAISDRILLKPGKLTSEEFEVMKAHVAQMLIIL